MLVKGVDTMLTFHLTSVTAGTDRPCVEQWIVRVGDGDREALAALYEETHAALYAYAWSMLKHTQDAQDVLHDCYMAVVNHAANYRAQGKPMAWLYTIARNLCLQRLRDRAKTADMPNDGWDIPMSEREDMTADDRMVLRACMERLTDEERQIVVLHAVAGLRHREIAALLSCNLSTVLSKYHRSLKKLRKEWEGGLLYEQKAD